MSLSQTNTLNIISASEVSPLKRGLGFAVKNWRLLLLVCLVPAAIEGLAAYLHYSRPLMPQQLFLVVVATLGANAWLLSVVLMTGIEWLQGRSPRASVLARKALRYLPKVLFSYLALLSLLFLSFLVLPLIFLVLLFIWAPAFCVGELYVPEPEDLEDEEEFDDEDDDYYVRPRKRTEPPGLFRDKSIFELGFARSLQFGVRHVGTTAQVFVLIWFAHVMPAAVVDLFSVTYLGFAPILFKILLSSYTDVFATAVAAGAFLMMLPKEARSEIGIGEEEIEEADGLPLPKRERLTKGQILFFLGLTALAAACTYVVFQQTVKEQEMPENALSELRAAGRFNEQFAVELSLVDSVRDFRWLDVERFRIAYPDAVTQQEPVDAESPEAETQGAEESMLYEPTRSIVYDADGNELQNDRFIPFYGPLRLKLYFPFPAGVPAEGRFSLHYQSYFSEDQLVLTGRYGREAAE